MENRHENVEIGQDAEGIYLMIPFGNEIEKVRVDEFLEDYAENREHVDITIKPHVKPRIKAEAFFEECTAEDRERIKKDLDLRVRYSPPRDDLNTHTYLTNLYKHNPPIYKYQAKSINEHQLWRGKVIGKVRELTKYNMGKVPFQVEEGPTSEYKNVILKKFYFMTAPFLKIPAILAYPKNITGKRPAIVTVHGHNRGKINTIGMLESASNSYYGIDLALRGYVTLSLDQWGWGEREGYYKKQEDTPEKVFSLTALLLGKTAIGIRAWEVSRAIDFLQTFDFVGDKFGVIGQSGGGTTAAFSSVLDERIDATVVSGYFCSWWHSIFSMNHCACNFVPGIMQYVDLPDIMATRAPKPTFIVAGECDPIFPLEGVKEGYKLLEEVYGMYDAKENLGIDVIPEVGHVFRGDHAYPWLDRMLK